MVKKLTKEDIEQGIEEVEEQRKKVLDTLDKKATLSILDNEEIEYQNLNQGIFNNEFYFGKLMQDNRKRFVKALIFSNKKLVSDVWIETENKNGRIEKSYVNNIKKLGLDYIHNLEINKNFWENKSIKAWLSSKNKLDISKFYKKVFDKINYFMDVKSDDIIHLATCWVIGTYCYELFETYGYLYFQALKDSGKSKFKKVLRLIGFNGQEASSITEASFFRTIEDTKGLLCIDEYERMDSERKKSTDLLLNAGIEKDASVKRYDMYAKRNKNFDVYCPKIICNITGLNPTTLSRCITIKMIRSRGNKGRRKPSATDKEFQEIRNLCYIFVLENWKKIKQSYDNYNVENLWNRDEDLWKPILAIAKVFSEDIEKKLIKLSEDLTKTKKQEEITNDFTYEILIKLLDNIGNEEIAEYETSWIKNLFVTHNFGEKKPENVIGWRLSSLNMFEKFNNGKNTGYKLSPKLLVKALYSRDYPIPEEYERYKEELERDT